MAKSKPAEPRFRAFGNRVLVKVLKDDVKSTAGGIALPDVPSTQEQWKRDVATGIVMSVGEGYVAQFSGTMCNTAPGLRPGCKVHFASAVGGVWRDRLHPDDEYVYLQDGDIFGVQVRED